MERMDYISLDVKGTVVSVPKRKGKNYSFAFENRRGDVISPFHVIVRDEGPIDVNKGDEIIITNAGFFVREGVNIIVVKEDSSIFPIRKRCNLGIEEV